MLTEGQGGRRATLKEERDSRDRGCCKTERERAVRTGRPGGSRSEAATTAADDRRSGEDGGGALVAVDVLGVEISL
ncbi:hypothetical protein L2E82_44719 [Cichorium intybus]|uniref:Uncharacterized protein n=1 Tax=Cichorium intybus TaxID=13427 RepID=A0ACB8ZR75_CICIN|nr:hypothetical protein L2E82_44719 [Cichorium intybus]